MIRRREFLTEVAALVVAGPAAAVIGCRLANAVKPQPVRIHTKEIDLADRILPGGRVLSWSSRDVDCQPDVGATLQIERTPGIDPDKKIGTLGFVGFQIERFRVIVVSHEDLEQ